MVLTCQWQYEHIKTKAAVDQSVEGQQLFPSVVLVLTFMLLTARHIPIPATAKNTNCNRIRNKLTVRLYGNELQQNKLHRNRSKRHV
jgi:hypothetical protein